MKIEIMPGRIDYDGSQIEPLWAYSLGIAGDSIVVFKGAMDIIPSNIKDMEDLLDNKAIKGGDVLHFIVERFNSPASLRLAYYLQRLLVVNTRDVLEGHGIRSIRKGDDIYVDGGKLTVCIASAGISSEKVHMGINILCQGTPTDVNVACLDDLGIEDVIGLAKEIASAFTAEIDDIESDIVKTKGL
ncbi:MAG: DUF366 family protein [Methanosarcinales archaeon]|nr:DUF366 family protein [Methanosarcinales archaeon]